jgi:hypothetical protein
MPSAGAAEIPDTSQKIVRRELHDPKTTEEVNADKTAGDTEEQIEAEETATGGEAGETIIELTPFQR